MYKMKRNEIVFFLAFIIFICSVVLEMTIWNVSLDGDPVFFSQVLKMMRYLSYGLCLLKILMDAVYARTEMITWGIICVLLLLCYIGSMNKTMVLYLLFFIAAREIYAEHIIKVAVWIQSVILVITVGLSQLGFIEDYIMEPDIRPRHFLGFSWTTTGAILYFFILLEYIYIKKGRLKLIEYCLLLGIDWWFYHMTDSRMAFVLSAAVLTFFWMFGRYITSEKSNKSFYRLFMFAPLLISVFAIILHAKYNSANEIYFKINSLLSGRLRLGYEAIADYGISLFGQPIEWIGFALGTDSSKAYNYVDCSYLQVMLEYGVVFLLIMIVLYSLAIRNAFIEKEYYLCWIFLFVLAFSITEPRLIDLAFNPFVLLGVSEPGRRCNQCIFQGEGRRRS